MGYTALYRQYRPLVFDGVIGQQHVTTTLMNQIKSGRIAHAYLFAGTRGTGKTSTARIFARAVNCLDLRDGNPCNSCEICGRALSGRLIDIIEIDAASNRGVDEIRDLREKVKYPPAEGRYRVYIVDEVHMLTAEAFNALLKTLEEPPAHVIFILATTEPHKLPATVLSRCQRFDFKRLSVPEITELMDHVVKKAGIEIERDALELIAGCVDGAARDALSLLDQCAASGREKLTLDRVVSILGMAHDKLLFGLSEGLAKRDAAGCIKLINRAVMDGRDTGQLFKDIIHHLRDVLIAKVSPSGLSDMSKEKIKALVALAGGMETNTLIRAINLLSDAQAKARWSPYPAVLLEVAVVKMCEPSMDESFEGLMDRVSRLEDILQTGKGAAAVPQRDKTPETTAPAPVETGDDSTKNDSGEPGSEPGSESGGEQDKEPYKKDKHEAAAANQSRGDITLEQLIKAWDKVLKRLEKGKMGLYTLIRDSKPIKVNGTALVIGSRELYEINREIANSEANRKALADAVFAVTGARFEVKVESSDQKEDFSKDDGEKTISLYQEAAGIFGSALVERLDDNDN